MILRAESLVKKYKKRTVVNNVSVEVHQGEIVGLLGPNGAGKTTSFYMIVGLIKPNEGKIFLDQEDITDLPMYQRAKRGIGYLAQEASVFRKLTVEENIMAPLEMREMSKKDRKEKGEKKEAIADFQKAISLFYKESLLEEIPTLQSEVRMLQKEQKNTSWWQMRVF